MASSTPWLVRASVRAMMRKSGSCRAAQAAWILLTISWASTTWRPSICPHFFGILWSSIWMAAAPARSYSRTVRTRLTTLPKPVSPSQITGMETAAHMSLARSAISLMVIRPTSGAPSLLAD